MSQSGDLANYMIPRKVSRFTNGHLFLRLTLNWPIDGQRLDTFNHDQGTLLTGAQEWVAPWIWFRIRREQRRVIESWRMDSVANN